MEENKERADAGPEGGGPEGSALEKPAESAPEGAAPEAEGMSSPEAEPAPAAAATAALEAEGTAAAPAGRPQGAGRYLVTAAISAGVLIFALAFFMAGFASHALLDEDGGSGDAGGGGDGGGNAAIAEGVADHDPAWGPKDAAVVVQEFADFQCPYCGKFALQTFPQIKEAYGDKVRFVFRDFPLTSLHGSAQKAAEAGQCAQDQGLFWEFHDLLFENQTALSISDLRGYAESVGADMNKFNDCLDSGRNTREVLVDMQDGAKAGVTGTPAFLINGLLLSGAQPFAQFQQAIDAALAAGQ